VISVDAADIAAYVAAFARAGALAETAPLLGDQTMPRTIRAVVVAVLAIAGAAVRGPLEPGQLYAVLPVEIAMGVLAGVAARIVLLGVETGGQLIGVEWGIGFAGQVDPSSGDEALPTRRIVATLAGLAFLGTGGLEAIVRVLTTPTPDISTLVLFAGDLPVRMGQVLVEAVRIAGPLMVAGFVVSLSTGLASRSAPAVNLFSVEFALRGLVALAVLVACAPALIAEINGAANLAHDALGLIVLRAPK
jgi:flagellar biosynthetic protein FliR